MKKGWIVTFNAPVVICLVVICFIATILNYVTEGNSLLVLFATYHSSLLSPMTWIRFFTHIFGHADLDHFVGNMSYLLLLGPMLEEKYSSHIMVAVIATTALITGLINYIVFPGSILCGASGVVFAFVVMSSFTSFKEGELPVTFLMVAIFFLGKQIFDGFFVQSNISNMAHVIGGIIGGIMGYILNLKGKEEKHEYTNIRNKEM